MKKGTIGVTTENIFPVIKKFLYSDHEIFLREIVANAVDASKKMKAVANDSEFKGELGDLIIKIDSDPKEHTITITDKGIGMTEEEVDKYINQIAFSSAGEFLEKYKDQNIIGHFGLGFYSAFMVAKKVTIDTLSWKEGAKAVKWSCEGNPDFEMTVGDKTERGTTITLYLDDESKDQAESSKVEGLLKKYCQFMEIPIAFGKETEWKDGKSVETDKDKIINNTTPIWVKKPSDLKEEDYLDFYKDLYPTLEAPMFYIHLNVDYPFHLTGVLYFPKIKDTMELTRNKIQLYCNQVFVTDSVENIVPDFMTLLHGVIDSPDIPLNVSRSYLQSDANVKKISKYITKKVADRLEEIYKNERPIFEKKWDNIKLFMEYGMLSDEKFFERAEKFALLKNTDGKYFNFEDYKKAIEPTQTDKDKKLVYLYTTNTVDQYTYIEAAKSKGYDVLIFDNQLDSHYVNLLESKFKDSTFTRVDADIIDNLIKKEDLSKPDLSAIEIEDLNAMIQPLMPSSANYQVTAANLGETGSPILITQSEFMRRYREMSKLGGQMNYFGEMPESYSITVNAEQPLIKTILEKKEKSTAAKADELEKKNNELQTSLDKINAETKDKKDEEISTETKDEKKRLEDEISKVKDSRKSIMADFAKDNTLLKQVIDLALLANNMLKGKALNDFITRSTQVLKK